MCRPADEFLVYGHRQRKTNATMRLQFAALLGRIRNGEMLVRAKLDRLGRDAQDVGATVKLLAGRKIAGIVLNWATWALPGWR